MSRHALTTATAVVAAFAIGLTWSWFTGTNHGVAVVDLDEVAHQLGRDVKMQESFQGATDQVQDDLKAIQQNAMAQLNQAKKDLGENPSREEAAKYLQMQRSAQLQLNQIKQNAEQQLSQHRQSLVLQFRREAQPIVARVAKEEGFSSVVTKNDAFLFSFDDTVDITDAVVAQMRSAAPAAPATPSPAPQRGATPATPAKETAATEPASTSAKTNTVQQVKHEEPAAPQTK